MPGARRIGGTADGGPLKGGAPRVVWQTAGADPRAVSARSAAEQLSRIGRACHLVWNPLQGEVVQLIPILRAGRLLGWPERLDPGVAEPWPADPRWPGPRAPGPAAAGRPAGGIGDVNAEGRLCVQICVVACAWEPFTSRPLSGLPRILGWLDSWGIPRRWPAGPPDPYPVGLRSRGDRRPWSRGGHFGASQVPGVTAAGPGGIDIDLLTAGKCPQVRWQHEPRYVPVGHASDHPAPAA